MKLMKMGLGCFMLIILLNCPAVGKNTLAEDINSLDEAEFSSILNELIDYLKNDQPPKPLRQVRTKKQKYQQQSLKK